MLQWHRCFFFPLQFIPKTIGLFKSCSLCCDLTVKDPAVTPCQHMFCRQCIATALSYQAECPIDRLPLRMSQVAPLTGPIKQLWQSIKVQCPKCTPWSGTLESYESHVLNCRQCNDEEIKKLQDEMASTACANLVLVEELASVNEELSDSLIRNQELENDLTQANAYLKHLKDECDKMEAEHLGTTRRLMGLLATATNPQTLALRSSTTSTNTTPTAPSLSSSLADVGITLERSAGVFYLFFVVLFVAAVCIGRAHSVVDILCIFFLLSPFAFLSLFANSIGWFSMSKLDVDQE